MSPCHHCHAGCCRAFAVPLTGADVLLIERDLELDFSEFACRWPDPNGSIARSYAPHFHFEDDPGTPYVICLMHTASEFLRGTTKCRFLIEGPPDDEHPLGQARCGIYGQRPLTCRVFPTKLNDTSELAVIEDMTGREASEPAYSLCPTAWSSDDLDAVAAMQHLVLAKYEMTFFHQLAEIWNRQPRGWNIFAEFLRVVYRGRLVEARDETPSVKLPTAASDARQPRAKAA